MIKVSCAWGEGPDVILTLENKPFMCYEPPTDLDKAINGFVYSGSMDLTQAQARELAADLLTAANACAELDEAYENYVKSEQGEE